MTKDKDSYVHIKRVSGKVEMSMTINLQNYLIKQVKCNFVAWSYISTHIIEKLR